jgi:hypothetical protein
VESLVESFVELDMADVYVDAAADQNEEGPASTNAEPTPRPKRAPQSNWRKNSPSSMMVKMRSRGVTQNGPTASY